MAQEFDESNFSEINFDYGFDSTRPGSEWTDWVKELGLSDSEVKAIKRNHYRVLNDGAELEKLNAYAKRAALTVKAKEYADGVDSILLTNLDKPILLDDRIKLYVWLFILKANENKSPKELWQVHRNKEILAKISLINRLLGEATNEPLAKANTHDYAANQKDKQALPYTGITAKRDLDEPGDMKLEPKLTPKNLTGWTYGKQFLSEVYGYEYLADTWPERLGIEDIAALQSGGKDYPIFEAWKACLTKAAQGGELVTHSVQWFLGSDEPSEFWTGKKRSKFFLIPPCHKHQGDDVLFFTSELVLRDTASAADFANYLQKIDEQPSQYISAWFDAFSIATAAPESRAVEVKPKQATKRTTKLNDWLRKKWDEWEKPNAKDFAAKLKPFQGSSFSPVKKYHGWYPEVVVEWQPGWGSTRGSWGIRAFQNKVDDFKREDKEAAEK